MSAHAERPSVNLVAECLYNYVEAKPLRDDAPSYASCAVALGFLPEDVLRAAWKDPRLDVRWGGSNAPYVVLADYPNEPSEPPDETTATDDKAVAMFGPFVRHGDPVDQSADDVPGKVYARTIERLVLMLEKRDKKLRKYREKWKHWRAMNDATLDTLAEERETRLEPYPEVRASAQCLIVCAQEYRSADHLADGWQRVADRLDIALERMRESLNDDY